jgi:hypothetical protein
MVLPVPALGGVPTAFSGIVTGTSGSVTLFTYGQSASLVGALQNSAPFSANGNTYNFYFFGSYPVAA